VHAEQVLLAFRKSSNVLPVCRFILQNTSTPAVQFHVASTIKEAIVREYGIMTPTDIEAWKSFLVEYLVQQPSILPYARETLAQALAVIVKRSWLESNQQQKEDMFRRATDLLNGEIHSVRLVYAAKLIR